MSDDKRDDKPEWKVGELNPAETLCPHRKHPNMKDNSIIIDECGCAVLEVSADGSVIYDYTLLVKHFAEHEGMRGDDDEDPFECAADWIWYNVIRGLPYAAGDGNILPIIVDDDVQLFPYDDEDDE